VLLFATRGGIVVASLVINPRYSLKSLREAPMENRNAKRLAMEGAQAGKPSFVQAAEFVREELRRELSNPKSRKTVREVVTAGLKKAKESGIDIGGSLRRRKAA